MKSTAEQDIERAFAEDRGQIPNGGKTDFPQQAASVAASSSGQVEDFSETERTGYTTEEEGSGNNVRLMKNQDPNIEAVRINNVPPKSDIHRIFEFVENEFRNPPSRKLRTALKYGSITAFDLMSLIMYTKVSFQIAKCDLNAKNPGCDRLTLGLSLFGNNVANAAVGFVTGKKGIEYFEAREIPDELKDIFSDFKGDWTEALLNIAEGAVALVSAFPIAAPMLVGMTKSGEGLTLGEMFLTLFSNGFFDVLPTIILYTLLTENPILFRLLFLVVQPSVAIPMEVGRLIYKTYKASRMTAGDKIFQTLLAERNAYLENERKSYLEKLQKFTRVVSEVVIPSDTCKKRMRPLLKELPEQHAELLNKLTPEGIDNFLRDFEHLDPKESRACSAGRISVQAGLTAGTVVGLFGYVFLSYVASAGIVLQGCDNPVQYLSNTTNCTNLMALTNYTLEAQTLANLSWKQWIAVTQFTNFSVVNFETMLIYFGWMGAGILALALAFRFQGMLGFQMNPIKALVIMAVTGVICYFSKYTGVDFMNTTTSALLSLTANASVMVFLTQIASFLANNVTFTNNWTSWMLIGDEILRATSNSPLVPLLQKVERISGFIKLMNLEKFAAAMQIPCESKEGLQEKVRQLLGKVSPETPEADIFREYKGVGKPKKSRNCCGLFGRSRNDGYEVLPTSVREEQQNSVIDLAHQYM